MEADGALPQECAEACEKLAEVIESVAARDAHKAAARLDKVHAALLLHSRDKRLREGTKEKQAVDQIALAASYRLRFQRSMCDGPTARRDAEEAENTSMGRVPCLAHQRHSVSDGANVEHQLEHGALPMNWHTSGHTPV